MTIFSWVSSQGISFYSFYQLKKQMSFFSKFTRTCNSPPIIEVIDVVFGAFIVHF